MARLQVKAEYPVMDALLAVAKAAEEGYARSMCGSCDAGLPMNCTCNPMDSALVSLHAIIEERT